MDAIDKMYIREKRNGLKYYDTLRLTFLLYIEYLYSIELASDKSIDDLINELSINNNYDEKEIIKMKDNASDLLKIKYSISITTFFPLTYRKNEN
ncbi:MAG: hypothetical protein Q4G04_06965 [bacterium]|nr:hypothetical protein [bacterium]